MSSSDALSRLTMDDIAVDSAGRVVIANTEIADFVKKGLGELADAAGGNSGCNFVQGGCQTNTAAHCGTIVEKI